MSVFFEFDKMIKACFVQSNNNGSFPFWRRKICFAKWNGIEMGSCSSCTDSTRKISFPCRTKKTQVWRSIPKSLGRISGCPYQERVRLCKIIQKGIRRKNRRNLPRNIQHFRYASIDLSVSQLKRGLTRQKGSLDILCN